MKITNIRTLVVNAKMRNWIFVKVETSIPGLYGWGEATLEWKTRGVVGTIEDLTPLLIGKDPRDIEQLVRVMHKHGFWKLGVIGTSAISGIEIALWDILGKSLNTPVWRLLGGKTHDKIKVYTHLGMGEMNAVYETSDTSSLIEKAHQVLEKGYKALKVVCIPYGHYLVTNQAIDHVSNLMQGLREAVGEEVEIMVDFHGRCPSSSAAIQFIKAIEPFRPLFVEEPIPPGDSLALKTIFDKISCPLATGERLVSTQEFEPLFQMRAINIAQPDLCHCGGFSGAKKIAQMAELAGIGIAPHNPLGPLAGVAALHFDIATPNFVIQEEMTGVVPWYHDVIEGGPVMDDGYWMVPQNPGLGIEVNEEEAKKYPFKQEILHATNAVLEDGTIVDW